jgi:hypothetical protein
MAVSFGCGEQLSHGFIHKAVEAIEPVQALGPEARD